MKIWRRVCLFASLGLFLLPIVAGESRILNGLNRFPKCALSCFTAAAPKSTCLVTDDNCLCHDDSMNTEIGACVESACTIKQALFTQNLTLSLCEFPIRDNTYTYKALAISLLVISSIFVLHRVIVKHVLRIGLGSDDWVIVATMLIVIASTTISLDKLIGNGLGHDLYTLTPENITSFLRYFQIVALLYFVQITLLKVSILLFYLRIFPTKSVRYVLWGSIGFNALFGVTYIFLTIFMCQPISYFWTQWDGEHHGKCADLNAITTANAAISIVTDLFMIFIPLSQVRSLNLDWKKKVGIALMFCIGTFVTIVSILRFSSVLKFGSDNKNPTWDYMPIAIWSLLEVDIGIICACMPAVRTLLAHLFSNVFGSIGRSNGRSNMDSYGQMRSNKSGKATAVSEDRSHPGLSSHRGARQSIFFTSADSTDEVHLVELRDMDKKSSKSEVSI